MARIGIIGSGFGGMAAAIELISHGHDDVVLFERADEVGGVWRENTYPGAACDVPSPYYSYSFERNPRWPRRYSAQPDILDYLRRVADTYDLRRRIRFGTEVTGASYDEAGRCWDVHLAGGGSERVDVLVPAVGQLSRPAWPAISGRERFAGPAFHSAQWDHSVDLTGRRVAVLGTGASAIQFVPEIQPDVARLSVFQRTAPYLLPRLDTAYSEIHHRLFEKVGVTQLAERGSWFTASEALAVAFLYSPRLNRVVRAASRAHMSHQCGDDRDLFEKVWPDYAFGCKRVLFSSNYLPALRQPNVDVVTGPIAEIIETGVRTRDGVVHEADVLIYGTGFTAQDFLAPLRVVGQGGLDLREQWTDGARAYYGLSVPRFPNLFVMYGPNTNLGTGSIVYMLESQARHVRRAVDHLAAQAGPAALAVRPEVEEAFDREMQARLVDGVWSKCQSWYRNEHGRISTNWPGTLSEYRRRTVAFDPDDYLLLG